MTKDSSAPFSCQSDVSALVDLLENSRAECARRVIPLKAVKL